MLLMDLGKQHFVQRLETWYLAGLKQRTAKRKER